VSYLLECSIPPEAYVAEPMTAAEIDTHPDAARIWRTIKEVRDMVFHDNPPISRLPLDFITY
jgi:hypothetical protein